MADQEQRGPNYDPSNTYQQTSSSGTGTAVLEEPDDGGGDGGDGGDGGSAPANAVLPYTPDSSNSLGGGGGGGRSPSLFDRLKDFAERKLRNNVLKRSAKKVWDKVTGKTAAKAEEEAAAKAAEKLAAEGGAKGAAEVLEKGAAEAAPKLAKGVLKGTAEVAGRLAEPLYVGYDVYKAGDEVRKGDYREAAGYAGDAGGFVAGAAAGAGLGALAGIETGPGAIVTGIVGGVVGGFIGEKSVKALYDRYKDKLPSWLGGKTAAPEQTQPAPAVTRQNNSLQGSATNPTSPPPASAAQTRAPTVSPTQASPPALPDKPHGHDYSALPGPQGMKVFAGDSLSFGIGGECCTGSDHNLAIPGSHIDGADGILGQLDKAAALNIQKGSQVTVLTGRNDVYVVNNATQLKTYREKLEVMAGKLDGLRGRGADIRWIAPIAGGDKDDALITKMAAIQEEVAKAHHFNLIKTNEQFKRLETDAKGNVDHVHPAEGYSPMANALVPDLVKPKTPKSAQNHPPAQQTVNHPAPLHSNYSNAKTSAQQIAEGAKAIDYFVHMGWKPYEAAAIVGNITRESGLDHQIPGDWNKTTGRYDALGLAQWHDDRQAEFKKVFGKDMKQASSEEEMAFIHYELTQGKYKSVGDDLKKTHTIAEATSLLRRRYEIPADKQGLEDGIRTGHAERAYQAYVSNNPNTELASRTPRPDPRKTLPSGPTPSSSNIKVADTEQPVHPVPHPHVVGAGLHDS